MMNFLISAVLAAAVALGIVYIVRSKKKGKGCAGCPYSKNCGGHC